MRLLIVLGLIAGILIAVVFLGGSYVGSLGSFLVVQDGPAPAGDVVLVRSYGLPPADEFEAAARLFLEGKAAHIMIAFHKARPHQRVLGGAGDQAKTITDYFRRNRISEENYSLVSVADGEPALIHDVFSVIPVLSRFAQKRSWHRVILVGRQFRMRRVLWTFQTFARDSSITFIPYSVPLGGVPTEVWWTSNDATNEVFGEYSKLIIFQFYRLKFSGSGFLAHASPHSALAH